MKKFISISLFLIYIGGSFHSAWILFEFYWNRDYYTQNYCINLDAGITQCQASCYLQSLLKADQNQGKKVQLNAEKKIKIEEQRNSIKPLDKPVYFFQLAIFHYQYNYESDFTDFVFHPPKG